MSSVRLGLAVAALLAFTMLIAGCGEAEQLNAPAAGIPPTMESSARAEVTATDTPEPATAEPVESAVATGTVEPWLDGRNDYGMLEALLEAAERSTFAGSFFEHEPEYRYVVLFTRDADHTLKKYVVPGSELDMLIEVRQAQFSLGDFDSLRAETNQIFEQLGFFAPQSSVNIMENRLEYMVHEPAEVEQLLSVAGMSLPASVDLIAGGGMLVSLATPEIVPGVYIAILKPQPIVERDAAFWEYTGTLAFEDGCLWVVPGQQSQRVMPIWPDSFRLLVADDIAEVVNSAGIAVARVGESIYLNGIEHDQSYLDRDELYVPIPEDCQPERVLDVISIDPLAHQPDMTPRAPDYSPFGLFAVQWPVNFPEVDTLASELPAYIGDPGMERWMRDEESGRRVIGYGSQDDPGSPSLTITDLTTGAYFPDYWTVNDLVASQLISGVGLDNGFSPATSWALEDTSISGRVDRYGSVPLYALTWGSNDGRVLFTATAADYAQLEMLVSAMVEAVE